MKVKPVKGWAVVCNDNQCKCGIFQEANLQYQIHSTIFEAEKARVNGYGSETLKVVEVKITPIQRKKRK